MEITLYHADTGSGKPLILLHGNGEDGSYFDCQKDALARHFRVIALDTRGHGRSPRGTAPFTISQFAEDLRCFMDHQGIARASLLGFSDGGNIALTFALRYPERVDRLVVVVPPTRHLAGEPSRRRAVDHDEPRPASHLLRRQLQEDSDEVGDRHAEFAGETFSGLHLPVGHAHVKLLRVPFHLPARLLEPRNRGRADARGARGIPRMERSRAAGGLRSRRPGSGRSVPKEGTRPGPPPRASGPAPGGAAKSYSGDCVHGIGLLLCSGSVRISRPAQRVEGFESFPENAIGLQRRYERGVQVGSPID